MLRRFFDPERVRELGSGKLKPYSMQARMLAALLPAVVAILFFTGWVTYQVSSHFVAVALQRNVQVQALAMAHAQEELLAQGRRVLLGAAAGRTQAQDAWAFLDRLTAAGQEPVLALGYISTNPRDTFLLMELPAGRRHLLDSQELGNLKPEPARLWELAESAPQGGVAIAPVGSGQLPREDSRQGGPRQVEGLVAMTTGRQVHGDEAGFWFLFLDARRLRNLLSLYNSPQSPLWAYARTPELRYGFLFDTEGWMLFQSENPENQGARLSTYMARDNLDGALGRPGLENAFRPGAANAAYWKMVAEVKQGKMGLLELSAGQAWVDTLKEHYLAFAPVMFSSGGNAKPFPYAGLAYLDRSRLTLAAGYKFIDALFLVTLASVALTALIIFSVCRALTRPLARLARAVAAVRESGELHTIDDQFQGYEPSSLRDAINSLILALREKLAVLREKERQIAAVGLQEKADMADLRALAASRAGSEGIPEIVGFGPKIESLKADIIKAAKVDVDVLIIGETGTGKQLAAEAVHRHSQRAAAPFIAINCGALDENLLMDSLFGHVKGAFTEARADRKGAFVEAQGGTLFLDEIQLASPKVQQALLRTLAVRKVRPLGSDRELEVDVRVITATNVDLRTLIKGQIFREDLYYRLKVITLQTPALRDHPENIPLIALYFLERSRELAGKPELSFSRGALAKLEAYPWPGNIRELENCITRAAVMCPGEVLQAEDILLDAEGHGVVAWGAASTVGAAEPAPAAPGPEPEPEAAPPAPAPPPTPTTPSAEAPRRPAPAGPAPEADPRLNPRQLAALDLLRRQGGFSRQEYQDLSGGVSPRTANYDLNQLVEMGLVIRKGRGPATRYQAP